MAGVMSSRVWHRRNQLAEQEGAPPTKKRCRHSCRAEPGILMVEGQLEHKGHELSLGILLCARTLSSLEVACDVQVSRGRCCQRVRQSRFRALADSAR